MRTGRVKPGFCQIVGGVVYPRWTKHIVSFAEPFHRGGAENGPTLSISVQCLWKGDWVSYELHTLICSIAKPGIHEVAQCHPRRFALANFLIGYSHCL